MPGALEGPPGWGVWYRHGPRKQDQGSGIGEHCSRERQGWGTPLGPGQQRSGPPPCPPPARCRRTSHEDTEALCGELRTLATSDSNKHRAKADRRRQRSTFRAVLHFVAGACAEGRVPRAGNPRLPGTAARAQSWLPLTCRAASVRSGDHPPGLECSTWTALGSGAGSTPPSRMRCLRDAPPPPRWAGRGGGGTLGWCHVDPSSWPSRPPEQRSCPGHLRPGSGAGVDAAAQRLQDLPFPRRFAPFSPLYCFGLASSQGLEEGPVPPPALLMRPSLFSPPAPVQRGGLQSQAPAAQPRAGQAGGRPVSRQSGPGLCFYFQVIRQHLVPARTCRFYFSNDN